MERAAKWFPMASLVGILYLAFTGVVVAPVAAVDWDVERGTSGLLFGVLLVLALEHVLSARFWVLPSMIARQRPHYRVVVIGHTHAVAAVMYGPLMSIITGQGLLTLPFAALALSGWVTIWAYLRRVSWVA